MSVKTELQEVWKLDPFTLYHLRDLWPILIIIIGLIPVIYLAMVHGHVFATGITGNENIWIGNTNVWYAPYGTV